MTDPAYNTVANGNGQTTTARKAAIDVDSNPRPALNRILDKYDFESYQDFLTKLAQASGIETPTRADLARRIVAAGIGPVNVWNVHSRTSTRPAACVACSCVGTPRGLQGRLSAALGALLVLIRAFWRLNASLAARWVSSALERVSIAR